MSSDFERVIRLSLSDLEPPEAQKFHAQVARTGLAEYISGQPSPPKFELFVDGNRGAVEESVRVPGEIRYKFAYIAEVVKFALATAVLKSPFGPGTTGPRHYRQAWFAMVDEVVIEPDAIPPDTVEVVVTNDQPYHRKIEVGHMRMSVPPGIVEATRQAVRRKYGNAVNAEVDYIELRGGYVLKGHFRPGRLLSARRKLRADTQADARMTYPALRLTFA